MVDSKLKSSIHDRWIISKNASFNIPSPDVVTRGQYSEVKKTGNITPFDDWWNNRLDIIDVRQSRIKQTKVENVRQRLQAHLEETKKQQDRLKQLISGLGNGQKSSATKDK